MNMGIRLIALDLDGTLLNSAKELTDYSIKILQKAAERGAYIVPSTGRSASGIPDKIANLPFIHYALTLNGAMVVDIRTNKIIHQCIYSREEAIKLWDFIQKYDALPDCAIDGELYMERKSFMRLSDYNQTPERIALMKRTRKETDNVRSLLLQDNAESAKMNLLFADTEKRMKAKRELLQIPFVEVSSSLPQNLELNRKGGNKGNGLLALADYLGLKRDELMACGDSDNDYSMIEVAGLGVAMSNASKELKDIADAVTLSNDEDGVAYAIEKWVLN